MESKVFFSKASAPGKAILFGEQAVVHGASAIAAAVSDLRIEVDMILLCNQGNNEVEITFEDLQLESGEKAIVSFPFSYISSLFPFESVDIDQPISPTVDLQGKLNSEFSRYPGNVASGIITIAFFTSFLILPDVRKCLDGESCDLKVSISSKGLPIGAGLGSSAAFSVASSAAAFQLVSKLTNPGVLSPTLDECTLERINNWAYSGEILMHGNPSGLDNTTSTYGGLVAFKKDPSLGIQFSSILSPPKMRILLVNTRIPRSTKTLVANVTSLFGSHPSIVKPLFDSITSITNTFRTSIDRLREMDTNDDSYLSTYTEFIEETGLLMDINHNILNAIGVGHFALTHVINIAAEADCHAKLTGAGGGGCAIILLPANSALALAKEEELSRLLRADNFDVFVSDIGGNGVLWH